MHPFLQTHLFLPFEVGNTVLGHLHSRIHMQMVNTQHFSLVEAFMIEAQTPQKHKPTPSYPLCLAPKSLATEFQSPLPLPDAKIFVKLTASFIHDKSS